MRLARLCVLLFEVWPSRLDAFEIALKQRRPDEVIHQSDHGSQYTSLAFEKRCEEDCELLNRRRFRTQTAARHAIFGFIEGWYNPRRHSALGSRLPLDYERIMQEAA